MAVASLDDEAALKQLIECPVNRVSASESKPTREFVGNGLDAVTAGFFLRVHAWRPSSDGEHGQHPECCVRERGNGRTLQQAFGHPSELFAISAKPSFHDRTRLRFPISRRGRQGTALRCVADAPTGCRQVPLIAFSRSASVGSAMRSASCTFMVVHHGIDLMQKAAGSSELAAFAVLG